MTKQIIQYYLVTTTKFLMIVLSSAFTVIIIYAVASRYILSFSLTWIEEVVRFLMAWIVFLGISVVLYERGHMGMQALLFKFNPKVQKILGMIFDILVILFLFIVFVEGCKLSLVGWEQTSPVAEVRYFWVYLSLPVGALLGVIQALIFIYDDIALFMNTKRI
jgi:TRAP-type C4-dicarboxylate transport system permease small subunit